MATKKKWLPDRNRLRLLRQFEQLQDIVQSQLDHMESNPESISASMLDTACKALKNLSGLLTELDAQAQAMKRKSKAQVDQSEILKNLPAPTVPATDDLSGLDFNDPPPVTLPFPLRGL